MLTYGNKDKYELGDTCICIKTNMKGVVIEGKISSNYHILWQDGSKSDLNNALENYEIKKECK